jgi:acetyl esterase/lipase
VYSPPLIPLSLLHLSDQVQLVSGVKGFNPFAPGTSIQSLRALSDRAPPSEPWADVRERDTKLPTRDGAENRARVYSPSSQDEGEAGNARPLFVMLHGGGYCLGKFENEEAICRTWVRRFGGVALSIEHRYVLMFMMG